MVFRALIVNRAQLNEEAWLERVCNVLAVWPPLTEISKGNEDEQVNARTNASAQAVRELQFLVACRLQVGELSSIIGLVRRAQTAYGRMFTMSGVIFAFQSARDSTL